MSPERMMGRKKPKEYVTTLLRRYSQAHSQSFQSRRWRRILARFRVSATASPRSRSMRDLTMAASEGVRKGRRVMSWGAVLRSGKSTMKMKPRRPRKMVMMPCWGGSLVGDLWIHAYHGQGS
jgi:hypothetical protein